MCGHFTVGYYNDWRNIIEMIEKLLKLDEIVIENIFNRTSHPSAISGKDISIVTGHNSSIIKDWQLNNFVELNSNNINKLQDISHHFKRIKYF